jgi:diguanylate cyclase (GGDEF)-like protein
LKELAQSDPLTGLSNRRHFEAQAIKQLELIRRLGTSAALFLFDVDKFKEINDSLGHGAGDNALVQVAGAVMARIRASDIFGRIGGDEFAVFLPGMERDQAAILANTLLTSIRASTIGSGADARGVTSSLGIALFVQPHEVDLVSLLASADRAMYVAKRGGGDRFAFDDQQAEFSLV